MASSAPPDYYAILDVEESASNQKIRDAYKRAALKTHPDRVPADSPERASRTRKFQLVNDAYYTLSDSARRREYDTQRKLFGGSRTKPKPKPKPSTGAHTTGGVPGSFSDEEWEEAFEEEIPAGGAGAQPNGFYSWAWNYFTGQSNPENTQQARQETENAQFGDVFEEMMREEGMEEARNQNKGGKMWSVAGGAAGGVLGFIMANFPGAVGGMVAGNRLGAIRDAKGKSVYSVFQDLPYDDRARLLTQLATKVFSHAVGV